MKKIIMILLTVIIGILIYKKNKEIIIPDDSIRIRIIANSNDIKDLYEKKLIKEEIEKDIMVLFNNVKTKEEAEEIIKNKTNEIEKIVSKKTINYQISYGINHFPKKIYKGIVYPEGEYNSLIISIGKGLGDNWWCVLYPPLCLINENEITSDIEYHSFVYDILKN